MELPGNEIHLYFSSPDEISDPGLLEQYESLLTDDERVQMSRLYFARHRHQFLVTRALVRTCLSAYCDIEPGDWRFSKNSYGKPEVKSPEVAGQVRFNLSHCRGLVMCGVTRNHEIGVDVEDAQRNTRTALDSLSSYFSASEVAEMSRLPADQKKQRFFDYWTLKESYIKARGMGLAIPLAKFSFRFQGDRLEGFETHPELNDDPANWQFWRISRPGGYRAAVALNSGNAGFSLRAFNTVPLKSDLAIQPAFL
jgi:4'-phosphopantetheinyl transferase